MARSVSTPSGTAYVEYAAAELDEFDWRWAMQDFQDKLLRAFPSTSKCDRWPGREDHAVVENNYAMFGVSEYCGLVAMWVLPVDYEYSTSNGFRDHWLDQIEKKFAAIAQSSFGTSLQCAGRFSNGEAIFNARSGQNQGAMGLGYSSKEGWL